MRSSYTEFKELLDYYELGHDAQVEKILDVYYLHFKFKNHDDLYLTKYALPISRYLLPHNFLTDREWYEKNSLALSGTGSTYKVRTKHVNGHQRDLVIKWNRMGQEVPGEDESEELVDAEFNSPFEEFSLLMELRDSRHESPGAIITQRPFAIFVPSERVELSRTGRKEYKMQAKVANHKEIELDMFRSYVVVYEWIKGIDAAHAYRENFIEQNEMMALTLRVDEEMKKKGFWVRDRKPHHIIVKPKNGGILATDRFGKILYAIIDYELLERTPERDVTVRRAKRTTYLKKQKDRFAVSPAGRLPPHLKQVHILGVDYIYGHVESTNGILWVVGKDPDLFDYFLPERWESTPRTKLSASHEIYHTLTKDGVNLVWKVSKVGLHPDADPFIEDEMKILEYGFNSPFEEISIAVELSSRGIRTTYPRAVYMFGRKLSISQSISDDRRYRSHRKYRTPEGHPILRKDHRYVILWGYWNGPDERLASKDGDYLEGINALNAYRKGMVEQDEYIGLLKRKKERLSRVGIEDLNLRGSHILLSLDSEGALLKGRDGVPEMRVCNFELLRRLS
jgi:hypothetical protein